MRMLLPIRSLVILPALVAAMLISSPARAQHEDHRTPALTQPPAAAPSSALLNACVASQRQGAILTDHAHARLEAARQNNSPTEMRAAVDDLQTVLAQIRVQLQACDPLAAAASAQGDPHAAHPMGGAPPPSVPAAPSAPATRPAEVDHSKMGHATAAKSRATPPAAKKPAGEPKAADVDHSKMPVGAATPKTGGAPGATKTVSPKLPVLPAERIADPSCADAVNQKNAPTATYQGKVYYFCSAADRDAFRKNPAAYLKKRPR